MPKIRRTPKDELFLAVMLAEMHARGLKGTRLRTFKDKFGRALTIGRAAHLTAPLTHNERSTSC